MEYESRLREMDEKHQHELQELENAYQQKIMGEVERYQVIPSKSRGYVSSVSLKLPCVESPSSLYQKCHFLSSQALVQERNMQQDRWNEQQQLLVTTHEK